MDRIYIYIVFLILFSFMLPSVEAKTAVEWYNEGTDLAQMGYFAETTKAFNEALKINPQFAEAWINKGRTLNELKRYEEALKAYDEALEINPQHADT